jgi:hypothetical protein
MGVELVVTFPDKRVPAWPQAAALLAGRGVAVQMRMIDGELAFPDEEPPESWREIRVASGGAMITIRRGDASVTLVGWGNMDESQKQLWHALAWAFASAGGGLVGPEGLTAEAFARQEGLA